MIYTHSTIRDALVSQYPELQTHGFKRAVLALLPQDDQEEWPLIDFVPDAYSILVAEKEIYLFEIEISHPLPKQKRESIAFFADAMEGYGWSVSIRVIDRYANVSSLNWRDMYTETITEEAAKATPEQVAEVRRYLSS